MSKLIKMVVVESISGEKIMPDNLRRIVKGVQQVILFIYIFILKFCKNYTVRPVKLKTKMTTFYKLVAVSI